jgi:hypothetical protein
MWIVRELLRLLERIALALAIALVIAAVQAPIRSHGSFVHGFQISCLVVGALFLLMAGVGSDTSFARRMDFGVTEAAWGRIPGVSTLERTGEEPTLAPGAVFVGAGVATLVVGFLV